MIASKIPDKENVNLKKPSQKWFAAKKYTPIKNKTNKIRRQSFIIFEAYTGRTTSFQWSLILSEKISLDAFVVTAKIKFNFEKTFNRAKVSSDKIQTNNKTR